MENAAAGFDCEEEIVPGLSRTDLKAISDQIFSKNDKNSPLYVHEGNNGFLDILTNAKADISASSTFVNKVSS